MKEYIQRFKEENIINKALTCALFAVIVFFIGRITYNMIMGLPYPNELLEPANIRLTKSFIDGNVPYSMKSLPSLGGEPAASYEYPFLNSLLCAGLSYIFGGQIILTHYLVSLFSIVGTGILGFLILNKKCDTTIGPAFAMLLLMYCHWRYGYVSAAPDDLGLFISILLFYLAVNEKVVRKPLYCSIGITLLFFTKQYFAFVAAALFIYMLLYSVKDALKLFLYSVLMVGVCCVVVNIFWPLYWSYSFLGLLNGCHVSLSMDSLRVVANQAMYLISIIAGMIVVMGFAGYKVIKGRKASIKASINNTAENNQADEKTTDKSQDVSEDGIDSNTSRKRKIRVPANSPLILSLIFIPISVCVLIVLGANDGAFLTYFLQLLLPYVVIATILCMEWLKPQKLEIIYQGMYAVLLLFTVYFGWGKLPMHVITAQEIANWQKAYALVDEYRPKGEVFYDKSMSYKGLSMGDSTFGTDHDGDLTEHCYTYWKDEAWRQMLFPDAYLLYEANIEYRKVIQDKIRNQEYEMVTKTVNHGIVFEETLLPNSGYVLLETIPLQLGNMQYETEFWVRP